MYRPRVRRTNPWVPLGDSPIYCISLSIHRYSSISLLSCTHRSDTITQQQTGKRKSVTTSWPGVRRRRDKMSGFSLPLCRWFKPSGWGEGDPKPASSILSLCLLERYSSVSALDNWNQIRVQGGLQQSASQPLGQEWKAILLIRTLDCKGKRRN